MMSLNSCLNATTIFQLFMAQTLGVEEEKAVLVQYCAKDLYPYTKRSNRVMKKVSNKFHREAVNIIGFSVVFAGMQKLGKVGPTFSSVSP